MVSLPSEQSSGLVECLLVVSMPPPGRRTTSPRPGERADPTRSSTRRRAAQDAVSNARPALTAVQVTRACLEIGFGGGGPGLYSRALGTGRRKNRLRFDCWLSLSSAGLVSVARSLFTFLNFAWGPGYLVQCQI